MEDIANEEEGAANNLPDGCFYFQTMLETENYNVMDCYGQLFIFHFYHILQNSAS